LLDGKRREGELTTDGGGDAGVVALVRTEEAALPISIITSAGCAP
jgi:hypothetical protein